VGVTEERGQVAEGHDEQLRRDVAAAARTPPGGWGSPALLLVGTLLLFVLTMGTGSSPARMAVIVGVLLFHEIGHWAGMRAFGYGDVRMFFIPFFGAAVSGRSEGVAPWKHGVVLVLGPLPGLALAAALGLSGAVADPLISQVAWVLVLVNGLNLLPFEPLDGGQLWRLAVFSRFAWLELATAVLSGLALVGIGVKLHTVPIAVLGGFLVMGVARRRRFLAAVAALRARFPAMSPRLAEASDAEMNALFDGAVSLAGAGLGKLTHARQVTSIAATARNVHARVTTSAPSAGQSVALLALGVGGIVLGAVAVGLITRRGVDVEPGWAPGAHEPLALGSTSDDGVVTLRHPASFHRDMKPSRPALTLVRRVAPGRAEALMWSTRPARAGETARSILDGLPEAGPALEEPTRCRGALGMEARWRKTVGGAAYEERDCAFVDGGRMHLAVVLMPADIAEAEAPVLREMVDAAETKP
jgi:Zn-dependent protease